MNKYKLIETLNLRPDVIETDKDLVDYLNTIGN
jgi:hypothetical protein